MMIVQIKKRNNWNLNLNLIKWNRKIERKKERETGKEKKDVVL